MTHPEFVQRVGDLLAAAPHKDGKSWDDCARTLRETMQSVGIITPTAEQTLRGNRPAAFAFLLAGAIVRDLAQPVVSAGEIALLIPVEKWAALMQVGVQFYRDASLELESSPAPGPGTGFYL